MDEQDEWLETAYDESDTIILHRFFDKHADKIGKELLSSSKPADQASVDGDPNGINGKSSWQAICAAIVENTTPLAGPTPATLSSRELPEYLDLMARYSHRDTSPVQHLFVEAIVPKVCTVLHYPVQDTHILCRVPMLSSCFQSPRSMLKS